MKTNVAARNLLKTHEGAMAHPIHAEQQLRRSVMSCLLWESEFYEDGQTIAQRICDLVPQVKPAAVAAIAIEAREQMKLRHVPLLLVREMARHVAYRPLVAETLARVIQRADEPAEFLAMYWKDGKIPVAHCVRRGLDAALRKFNEYELGKYKGERDKIKLRDVLRVVRPFPANVEQAELWRKIVKGELATPDTWEVALSANDGLNKRDKWTRLLTENKLGALALLRNLRNMEQEGVNNGLIIKALDKADLSRVLPFRFVAAAQAAPRLESAIDQAMLRCLQQSPKLPGKTIIVIDISGSMRSALSAKSDMTRLTAACALGAIARELCEQPVIYATAGSDWERQHATGIVPARRGMALVDAIVGMRKTLGVGGIFLKQVVDYILEQEKTADRMIVITDEQDCGIDSKDSPLLAKPFGRHNYLLNVASARNGIGYGAWTHIDGFSEAVFQYLLRAEKDELQLA